MGKQIAVTAALCCALATMAARAETYELEADHSRILFFVPHIGMSKMPGQFHTFTGSIDYDSAHPEKSSVKVVIQANSVDMDHQVLNEKLNGPDFFRTKDFPELRFVSTSIERTGDDTGRLHGNLTLLGVTRPVVLDAHLNKVGIHPLFQRKAMGISATGHLSRSEFGMTIAPQYIGDEIEIRIELEAQVPPCQPAPGAHGGCS